MSKFTRSEMAEACKIEAILLRANAMDDIRACLTQAFILESTAAQLLADEKAVENEFEKYCQASCEHCKKEWREVERVAEPVPGNSVNWKHKYTERECWASRIRERRYQESKPPVEPAKEKRDDAV